MTIHIPKIAIVGEGVIGCSSALQLFKTIPDAKITVFHDRPFKDTCSAGPAGLFRIDFEQNTEYGRETFKWFSHLYRTTKGGDTGVKLISGHIQSDSKEKLEQQQRAYGDVVYNFRFLDDRERLDIFDNPSKHCIHYTAYCSEGNQYVPYLKSLLTKQGVEFKARTIDSFDSLADENFDIVMNCAGLNGGRLAGDDDTVYPVRGVIFEVDAPWHKHFMYRDFETFTIPKTNTVVLGSVKQDNRWDLEITDEDRKSILDRYLNLHPGMKGVKIVSEWSALRPMRKDIRIESVQKKSMKGKEYTVVHHYGHGSNGFTLGWGTARVATDLVHKALNLKTTL